MRHDGQAAITNGNTNISAIAAMLRRFSFHFLHSSLFPSPPYREHVRVLIMPAPMLRSRVARLRLWWRKASLSFPFTFSIFS